MGGEDEIKVPLTDYTREVVRMAILEAHEDWAEMLKQHRKDCPIDDTVKRIANQELRFATLLGWLAGAGVVGGVFGAGIAKLIGV